MVNQSLQVTNWNSRVSEFSQGYGNKSKGSGESKFYGLAATKCPTIVETEIKIFDFGMCRSRENAILHMWFSSIHQCKYGWYYVILLKFERTDQINLSNRLKTNTNLRYFWEILKPYLPSLPDLNSVNTANHKRQFYKHCKCQK